MTTTDPFDGYDLDPFDLVEEVDPATLRISCTGETRIFGVHVGTDRRLYEYIRFLTTPASTRIDYDDALGDVEVITETSTSSDVTFHAKGLSYVVLAKDHAYCFGQRETDPHRIFGSLIDWMNAAQA